MSFPGIAEYVRYVAAGIIENAKESGKAEQEEYNCDKYNACISKVMVHSCL